METRTAPVTAIVITKNEEEMIANCLETLQWCQDVIVVDSGSSDMTVGLAERAGATVITDKSESFAQRRTVALKHVNTAWVLYVDADERVTLQLAAEIQQQIAATTHSVFRVRRNDIHYGKWMEHGGWEADWVERVFRADALLEWTGMVHESPQFSGTVGSLSESLVHLTHRNMTDGLRKTIEWTGYEAQMLFEAKYPPVSARTFVRKSVMEVIRRLIIKQGYKDGIEGWIEALTQGMNKFIVYQRLWELQRSPTLDDTYQKIDETIVKQWQKKHH